MRLQPMRLGLEPAFAPGGWPLAGMALAQFEPEDPDLEIPRGAVQSGLREAPERIRIIDQSARLADTLPKPLGVAVKRPADRKRKWTAALVASCVFHAAVAFLFIGTNSEDVLIEGSDLSGIAFLGSAPEDQLSAGAETDDPNAVAVTMITMVEAQPVETVEAARAEITEPAKAAPDETPPTDTVEPLETAALEPAKIVEAQAVRAETLETSPDIPLENIPLPTPRPVEKPIEVAAQAEPTAAKPKPATKVAKNPAKKPAAKAAKARQSGNAGKNEADAQRGQADGRADGGTAATSKGGKNSAAGNAAISNYPGKVASKLRRALRYPAEAKRRKLRGQAQVSFVVSASGGVGSIRVVLSSGSPILDKAAIETVRRAAPFPAIPAGAARSSWPFTVPLAFNR